MPTALALDGSGYAGRLTHFSDDPGFKASNPVVSDDGRFVAFVSDSTGAAIPAAAVYFIVWWMVLFAVLPFGLRTHELGGNGGERHGALR